MPSVFMLTPGSRASLVSERLLVEIPPQEDSGMSVTRDLPLFDIEQVVITASVHLSTAALAELLRRGIPVVVTDHGERVIGLCQPPAPNNTARLAQYRVAGQNELALGYASAWVEAKIINSRRVLQRLAANRQDVNVDAEVAGLLELVKKAHGASSLDVLRGYEGTSAGQYFEAYARFFPDESPFERRSRRPPHNPPNALLSYAYTLLCAEMECTIHTIGLDPCVGFLHEPQDGRPSLALDMMEPFRAPVADALALDLLGHGTLKGRTHFEERDGGVYMNNEGKKRFFVDYERRLTREFFSEQTGRRTTLRDEFHHQAVSFKQALVDGVLPEVFRMN